MNLLDPLDPDTIVGDVEIIEDIRRIILSEDLMDGQQTFQDTSLPCVKEKTQKHNFFYFINKNKKINVHEKQNCLLFLNKKKNLFPATLILSKQTLISAIFLKYIYFRLRMFKSVYWKK